MIDAHPFSLDPTLDIDGAARAFRQVGRVQIARFLAPTAAVHLARHLRERDDWRHVLNGSTTVFEVGRREFDAMSQEQRSKITDAVHVAAAEGFQFRYDVIRVADHLAAVPKPAALLEQVALQLRSPEMLSVFRRLTGLQIAFADAQATLYRPGDFLTGHDDAVPGKDRLAAYVLNLSPRWRIEWGGLLLFHGPDDGVTAGLMPKFGSLNIFRVPQRHSVSLVAPFAPEPRLAITGWLRSRVPEVG